MLGKKTRPVIGKLAAVSGSGNRTMFTETATSPKSPLDFKTQLPRGLLVMKKTYDVGGIGLGIVAALEKSGEQNYGRQIRAAKALFLQNITRSDPIPVNNKNLSATHRGGEAKMEEMDFDDSSDSEEEEEEYTYVTRRGGPNNEACTRVYCDGVEQRRIAMGEGRQRLDSRRSGEKNPAFCCVFDISPGRFSDDSLSSPTSSDFLSSCHLCLKKLHGKDIYMYRGEKGFCSPECRYRQILMDERKDQHYCSSEASRSSSSSRSRSRDHANVINNASTSSSSPYSNAQIFSPGILAT